VYGAALIAYEPLEGKIGRLLNIMCAVSFILTMNIARALQSRSEHSLNLTMYLSVDPGVKLLDDRTTPAPIQPVDPKAAPAKPAPARVIYCPRCVCLLSQWPFYDGR